MLRSVGLTMINRDDQDRAIFLQHISMSRWYHQRRVPKGSSPWPQWSPMTKGWLLIIGVMGQKRWPQGKWPSSPCPDPSMIIDFTRQAFCMISQGSFISHWPPASLKCLLEVTLATGPPDHFHVVDTGVPSLSATNIFMAKQDDVTFPSHPLGRQKCGFA